MMAGLMRLLRRGRILKKKEGSLQAALLILTPAELLCRLKPSQG